MERSLGQQYTWQSGDGTTLFGLEVRTPTVEEAQDLGEPLQSENVQCVKFLILLLWIRKPGHVRQQGILTKEIRIKKLVTFNNDKDPRMRGRSDFLDGSSQACVSNARSMNMQTSNRFEVPGRTECGPKSTRSESGKRPSQEPRPRLGAPR